MARSFTTSLRALRVIAAALALVTRAQAQTTIRPSADDLVEVLFALEGRAMGDDDLLAKYISRNLCGDAVQFFGTSEFAAPRTLGEFRQAHGRQIQQAGSRLLDATFVTTVGARLGTYDFPKQRFPIEVPANVYQQNGALLLDGRTLASRPGPPDCSDILRRRGVRFGGGSYMRFWSVALDRDLRTLALPLPPGPAQALSQTEGRALEIDIAYRLDDSNGGGGMFGNQAGFDGRALRMQVFSTGVGRPRRLLCEIGPNPSSRPPTRQAPTPPPVAGTPAPWRAQYGGVAPAFPQGDAAPAAAAATLCVP